ncbi:S8 family serine peptidase [Natrinema amylolyticum]|uniref:S8 family serine peptidase n=1 Tax=Natrinema amylolyticum TaxID=2878679 RepID=UPI001CFB2877|nr:S8 family serine peptidase [Natrinema amylolyticum]
MFLRPSGTGRRVRAGLVLGLLLFVVCGLIATPVSTAPGPAVSEEPPTGTAAESGISIDSALESDTDSETVDVIVRLSEANVAAAATRERTTARLKRHAERTQGPVVSYARSTEGVTVRNRFWVTNAVLLSVDTNRVDLESFGRFDEVSTLHTNFEVEVDGAAATGTAGTGSNGSSSTESTTTRATGTTDGLDQINAPAVWDEYETNGTGAKVAVLDTGVDAAHPDIDLYTTDPSDPTYPGGWVEFDSDGNVVPGSTPRDFGDHGTHVSGTAAGGAASGTHIGVAPGADLIHGAVFTDCDTTCHGTYSQLLEGMQWAIDRDADVVSMSLGVRDYEERFIEPVRNAQAAGTVVVSSVGNSGEGTSGSPANVYETFAIGASTRSGDIAEFSGGETIVTDDAWSSRPADWPDAYTVPDVAAPGLWVNSSAPNGGYQRKSGTSMAAPHVAGSVALLRSVDGELRPGEITTALEETARKPDGADPGQDTRYGHGIVDVKGAADAISTATVTGTVTGGDGDPIDGATVSVDGGRWTATTDGNGHYELRVAPGDRTVTVAAASHYTTTETLELSRNESVTRDVSLVPTDFVEGLAEQDRPNPIEANGSVTTTFDVTGIDALTITPTENATIEPDALEFAVDGTRFGPNETVTFEPAVTDDRFTVTTRVAADRNGTLEFDYEFGRSGETQTVSPGPTRVVPEFYDVGVVADPGDAAAERLRADLTDELPIAYRPTRINTTDAVTAAESGEYDVFVALELPANGGNRTTRTTRANLTEAFVDATAANDTGVLYLGDGVGDDALARLATDTSVVDRLETPGHDGPDEVVLERNHPLFDGVAFRTDAVAVRENATNRTWFDAGETRTLASATDDGVLADGTALAIDRPDDRIALGVTPQTGRLTDDGRRIVTNAVEYLGAGRFHVRDDLETYGVSNGSAETATFAVPETGTVTVALANGTTVESANVSLAVNGSDVAPGDEIAVDRDAVAEGIAVDVTVADGVTGTVRLAATFENETVTTSPTRFEREPPARYAGTVAVNGKPARDGLTVRAAHNGTVVAETATESGRFGVPTADGGGGAFEVNASTVPENATLTLALENATTNASPTWSAGGETRTDLALAYDDPFDRTTVSAHRWTSTGAASPVSIAFDGETAQYFTDRTWLGEYETVPADRWNATRTYGPADEGVVTVSAQLTDLAGETRTISTRTLVIDGEIASIDGRIGLSASEGTQTDGNETDLDGSVLLTPAHGNWTDRRSVENGTFEAATEATAFTHAVFLEASGDYPRYRTLFDRTVDDNETVVTELAEGHELEVEVTNSSGVGIPNASVAVTPVGAAERETAVVTRETTTDESGQWTGPNGDGLGATVDGPVTVTVTPPDDAGYAEEPSVRTLTVDEPRTASFELADRADGDRAGGDNESSDDDTDNGSGDRERSADDGSTGGSGSGASSGGGGGSSASGGSSGGGASSGGSGSSGGGSIGGGSAAPSEDGDPASDEMRFTSTTGDDGRALLEASGSRRNRSAETSLTGVDADGVAFERVAIVPATNRSSYAFALRPGHRGNVSHRDGAVAYADFDHDDIAATIGSLTIEFTVADEAIPDGTAPEDVVVAASRDGSWRAVETTYDAETGTHSATVSGLPALAIGVDGASPEFAVVDSSLEPTETRAGSPVAIEATVENVGAVAGTDDVTIAADGAPLVTERVGLGPGERETIAVEATFDASATITAAGSTLGNVTVTDDAVADEPTTGEGTSNDSTADGSATDSAATDEASEESTADSVAADDSSSASDDIPGFGGLVAVSAIATVLFVRARFSDFDR